MTWRWWRGLLGYPKPRLAHRLAAWARYGIMRRAILAVVFIVTISALISANLSDRVIDHGKF